MADINFLSENGSGRDEKSGKNGKTREEFEWTKPNGDASKKEKFKMLSREKEDKKSSVLTSKKEGFSSLSESGAAGLAADREKLKQSRQEVIKSLKTEKMGAKGLIKESEAKGIGFFSWWGKIFKKGEPAIEPREDFGKYLSNGENIKKAGAEPFGFKREKTERESREKKEKLLFETGHLEEKATNIKKDLEPEKEKIKQEKEEKLKTKKESWLIKIFDFFKSQRKAKEVKKEERPGIEVELKSEKAAASVAEKLSQEMPAKEETGKEKWESSKILETNLIKGEVYSFFNWEKAILILIFYLAGAGILVSVMYAGLIYVGARPDQRVVLSERIEEIKKQIGPLELKAKEIMEFQNRLKQAGELLRNHVYWTNFFAFLEEGMLPDIKLASVAGNIEGGYSFSTSAKNFRTMVDQINYLRIKDYVVSAKVTEGKFSDKSEESTEKKGEKEELTETSEVAETKKQESSVSFNLSLEIDPEIFTKGPYLDKVEPLSGTKGQYISIYGINFRKYVKGASSVRFYNNSLNKYIDADVSFPANCADNWWTNSYIVVKVPELSKGAWQLVVKNNEGEAVYENNFAYSNEGKAGPGVCLVAPNYGYKGKILSIYGEGFGLSEDKGFIKINDLLSAPASWADKLITGEVLEGAKSGFVSIVTGNKETSNSFPYIQLH